MTNWTDEPPAPPAGGSSSLSVVVRSVKDWARRLERPAWPPPRGDCGSAQPARSRCRNATDPQASNPPATTVNHTIAASFGSGPGSTGEWAKGVRSITHRGTPQSWANSPTTMNPAQAPPPGGGCVRPNAPKGNDEANQDPRGRDPGEARDSYAQDLAGVADRKTLSGHPLTGVGRFPNLAGGPAGPATRETLHCCRRA